MNRRSFIHTLAGSLLAAPLAAEAQRIGRIPQIGVLWHAGNEQEERIPLGALRQGLRDLGYVEGKSIVLENRFPNEQPAGFVNLAADLAELKVDVLIAVTRPAALAAQRATATIPIVFMAVPDPVGDKLVDNLARPGKNITGITNMALQLTTKRIELLREAIPGLSRMALLVNMSHPEGARRYIEMGQTTARALGLTLQPVEVSGVDDFPRAFALMSKSKAEGVSVTVDGLFYAEQSRLIRLALEYRLPMMMYSREMAEAGALLSYGPSNVASFLRTAYFIDKILKGVKPSDLPVEQPPVIELLINGKTAKTLGLTIPQALLLRADQVIE